MTKTIAVVGKGGTGKTTISALLITMLKEKGAVLAIDGDPSSNLHMALGLPLDETVGRVREDMAKLASKGRLEGGISKPDYLEMKIFEALVESKGVDLLAMGRPEGPGCYCAANNMLRHSIDRLGSNYQFVVIDSEAGMEHISRQTTRDVDVLLIVSDPTMRGISAAIRTKELIAEMRTHVERVVLMVNRVGDGLSPQIQQAIAEAGLELITTLPEDPALAALEQVGAPLTELATDSPVRQAVAAVAEELGLL